MSAGGIGEIFLWNIKCVKNSGCGILNPLIRLSMLIF